MERAEIDLTEAAILYERSVTDRAGRLEAILYSVSAARRILGRQHDDNILDPLEYLVAALSRLLSGRDDPVLKPLREPGRGGRPGADGATQFKMISCLFAVEILERAGFSKGAAYREVAEFAAAESLTGPDGRPVSADMIRNWRSRMRTKPDLRFLKSIFEDRVKTLPHPSSREDARSLARQRLIEVGKRQGVELSKNTPLT